MLKKIILLIVIAVFISAYLFYQKMITPDAMKSVRVTNLPWQITVISPQVLHVLDLDIGKSTLADAVNVFNTEHKLAWFERSNQSISLEAYFLRVSLSGLRAKVVLELDTDKLDMAYLKSKSGEPEILESRSIKYPLDDLTQDMGNRTIKSLTYVPASSVDAEIIKERFGIAKEKLPVDSNTEFWLYPEKGLVITINKKGKEAFQYVPVAYFERLKAFVLSNINSSNNK